MKYLNLVKNETLDLLKDSYSQTAIPSINLFKDKILIPREANKAEKANLMLAMYILGYANISIYDYMSGLEEGAITPRLDEFKTLLSGITKEEAVRILGDSSKEVFETNRVNIAVNLLFSAIEDFDTIQSLIADECVNGSGYTLSENRLFDINNDKSIDQNELLLLSKLWDFFPENISFAGAINARLKNDAKTSNIYDAVSYTIGTGISSITESNLDLNDDGKFDYDDLSVYLSYQIFGSTMGGMITSSSTMTSTKVITAFNSGLTLTNKMSRKIEKIITEESVDITYTTTLSSSAMATTASTSFPKYSSKLNYSDCATCELPPDPISIFGEDPFEEVGAGTTLDPWEKGEDIVIDLGVKGEAFSDDDGTQESSYYHTSEIGDVLIKTILVVPSKTGLSNKQYRYDMIVECDKEFVFSSPIAQEKVMNLLLESIHENGINKSTIIYENGSATTLGNKIQLDFASYTELEDYDLDNVNIIFNGMYPYSFTYKRNAANATENAELTIFRIKQTYIH